MKVVNGALPMIRDKIMKKRRECNVWSEDMSLKIEGEEEEKGSYGPKKGRGMLWKWKEVERDVTMRKKKVGRIWKNWEENKKRIWKKKLWC